MNSKKENRKRNKGGFAKKNSSTLTKQDKVQYTHHNANNTIPTSTNSIQINIFKTTFHILKTLPTYKYITSKQHSCVQGPLRECIGQALLEFLITVHHLCVFLLYLEG